MRRAFVCHYNDQSAQCVLFKAGQSRDNIVIVAVKAWTKISSINLLCINLPSAFLHRAQNRSAVSANVFVLIVLLPCDEMIRDSETVC